MQKSQRYHLSILALIIASSLIIGVFLPQRSSTADYTREVGYAWTHPTLIAPFELELELTNEQAQHIRDSIAAHFIDKYFCYDNNIAQTQLQRIDSIPELTPTVRGKVKAIIRQVYADRILDNIIADSLANQHFTTIKLRENTNELQTREVETAKMRSQAQAYEYVDTILTAQGIRSALSTVDLAEYIRPNIVVDTEFNSKLLADEQDRAVSAQRKHLSDDKIQAREEIVRSGQRVSERQDRYIKLLEDKLKINTNQDNITWRIIGQFFVVLLLLLVFYTFIRMMRPHLYGRLRNWVFFLSVITIFVIIVLLTMKYKPRYIMLIPFALAPIIVTTYYDERTSFFIHLVVILICSIVMPEPTQFLVMQFLAGVIAVASMQELTRRSQLVVCAAFIFLAYIVSYVAMQLIQGHSPREIDWTGYLLYFAINCVVLSFAYMAIYLVDKVFGFTSTISLEELTDIGSPLLRRLAEACPGTSQHSLQVANIAGEAAMAIGANVQLVRTGALYHDIGKIENPAFFTENQRGVNPHDALTPEQSAQIVVQHVADGLRLAAQFRLPSVIRDMISQHHGKGITRYFYLQACKEAGNEHINPEPFSYPGPNPQTREAAILMMADSCEAATKSLKDPNKETIAALVERIVNTQVTEGLLREAPITFKEVETVKRVLSERLSAIYYTRISYPDDIKPNENEEPAVTDLDANNP